MSSAIINSGQKQSERKVDFYRKDYYGVLAGALGNTGDFRDTPDAKNKATAALMDYGVTEGLEDLAVSDPFNVHRVSLGQDSQSPEAQKARLLANRKRNSPGFSQQSALSV